MGAGENEDPGRDQGRGREVDREVGRGRGVGGVRNEGKVMGLRGQNTGSGLEC